jgi:hypothetical protein
MWLQQRGRDCYTRGTVKTDIAIMCMFVRCDVIRTTQMRQMEKTSESIVEVLEADIQACNSKLDTTAAEVSDRYYAAL